MAYNGNDVGDRSNSELYDCERKYLKYRSIYFLNISVICFLSKRSQYFYEYFQKFFSIFDILHHW